MSWMGILGVAVAAIFVFVLFRLIKNNPQAFSKENFSKSAFTLGMLALFIIVVILIGVLTLR